MKIRLTESQYKRLLTEDDKSFLGGEVDFPNIGNKINRPIALAFMKLHIEPDTRYLRLNFPKQSSIFENIVNKLVLMMGITEDEAILLGHNYCSVYPDEILKAKEENDYSSLIDLPLEFYGLFRYPTIAYYNGYISGSSDGFAQRYSKNYEDFINKIKEGDVDVENVDRSPIEYDTDEIDWEFYWDGTYDYLTDSNDKIKINNIEIYFRKV
jgi:hypothetical protein